MLRNLFRKMTSIFLSFPGHPLLGIDSSTPNAHPYVNLRINASVQGN